MVRYSLLFLSLLMSLGVSSQVGAKKEKSSQKNLTFLVYIAADNDLASFVQQDIDEMQKVGSSSKLNILVYLTTQDHGRKVTKKLYITKNKVVEIGNEPARDSGDPQTVIDACAWAHTYYPSKQFALVLWDHGSGSLNRNGFMKRSWLMPEGACLDESGTRAVCYDDTTGNVLTDADLKKALSTVCEKYRKGKKIDVLAFDACLMADIEVAYAVEPYVNFMVASQETVPGKGFGYEHVLKDPALKALPSYDLARKMVRAHRLEYEGKESSHTMSALDLSWLWPVVNNVNKVSQLLTDILVNGSERDQLTLAECIHKSKSSDLCVQFSDETYLDFDNFYSNLIYHLEYVSFDDISAKTSLLYYLRRGRQKSRNLVIANVYGSDYYQTCGVSIYFRKKRIDSTYPQLIWSTKTSWLSFLKAYDAI